MRRYVHYAPIAPLFVLTVVVLMAIEIGASAFLGFGLLLLMLPIQAEVPSAHYSVSPSPPAAHVIIVLLLDL